MPNTSQTEVTPYALRIPDAVKYSGLSRSMLYVLENQGKLTMIKVAGRRLILRSDLEAFLSSRRQAA
jgi:predicted DNA-binding transcriptional regulator AlpA